YVANSNSANVTVLDTTTNTVVGAPIPVGSFPRGVGLDPTVHRAYVANLGSSTVTVLDTTAHTDGPTLAVRHGRNADGPALPGSGAGSGAGAGRPGGRHGVARRRRYGALRQRRLRAAVPRRPRRHPADPRPRRARRRRGPRPPRPRPPVHLHLSRDPLTSLA